MCDHGSGVEVETLLACGGSLLVGAVLPQLPAPTNTPRTIRVG